MRISKAFTVKGDAGKILDLTEKYVPEMKYKRTTSVKSSSLIFERGITSVAFALSPSIENVKITLAVSFAQKAGDVHILCDYDVDIGMGAPYVMPLISALESEVERLKFYLQTAL